MKTFAFVFPGQGSQQIGMFRELSNNFPLEETFNQASDCLGYDLWKLTQEGPAEKLNETACTQPALLAAGVAIWRCWQKIKGPQPEFLAGHSLGEYTALVCANAIQFPTAVKLVEKRGKYMQAAVPPGQGSMAAIIGLSEQVVNELCALASEENKTVSAANYNSIGQIVVSGDTVAVDHAIALAKERGAKLAKKLPVSVPSHCALMKPAAMQFAEDLQAITIKTPDLPVIHNTDVCAYHAPKMIRDALIRQLYTPVRWIETIQFLGARFIPVIIESGPGKVLTGLNKRILPHLTATAITDAPSFQEALTILGE